MKKLLSLLILPLVAVMCLVGCGKDKTPADIKAYYDSMKSAYIEEETNIFFSNSEKPNTISFAYNDTLNGYMDRTNTSNLTDVQKSYIALGYQQKILNNAFSFYEKYNEEFYRVMSSADYKKSELNNLYSSLESLNNTLSDFKVQYSQFMNNVSSASNMLFALHSYSYELNKVIDSSFDFVYDFIDVYNKYVAGDDKMTSVSVSLKIDIANIDIANIVYLENIKVFNYSVGGKGECDLLPLVENKTNKYNLIHAKVECNNILTDGGRELSSYVAENLNESAENYEDNIAKVKEFNYARELMSQRLTAYKNILSSVDMYQANQYRFELVGGTEYIDYDTYKSSLSASDRANINALENFIEDIFKPFIEKMCLLAI